MEWDFEKIDHIPPDVRERCFLAKEIAAAGNAVFERQGFDGKGSVLINHLVLFPFHRMKYNFVVHAATKIVEPRAHESFEVVTGAIDMEFGSASEQIESAEQTN